MINLPIAGVIDCPERNGDGGNGAIGKFLQHVVDGGCVAPKA
ncbi:hypothetical protein [Novipirellula herctigrandis]